MSLFLEQTGDLIMKIDELREYLVGVYQMVKEPVIPEIDHQPFTRTALDRMERIEPDLELTILSEELIGSKVYRDRPMVQTAVIKTNVGVFRVNYLGIYLGINMPPFL